MADSKYLKGFTQVMSNLRKASAAIEGKTMAGLIHAAVLIRRDMDETPPLIPVDTGNLRSSWFTMPFRTAQGPSLNIGFTANYAVFVHENVDANFKGNQKKIKYTKSGKVTAATRKHTRREGAGPKFFEESLKRNEQEILNIISKHAKI